MRVATYNLFNLFHTRSDEEMAARGRVLEEVAADVVALQEVGGRKALARLNRSLTEPYRHALFLPGNSKRGIHLGFLSRRPLRLTSHRRLPLTDGAGEALRGWDNAGAARRRQRKRLRLRRDALLAELSLNGGETLLLLNLHLKSRYDPGWVEPPPALYRAAEARAVAGLADRLERRGPLAVLGDLNDDPDSPALAPLLGRPGWRDPLAADSDSSVTLHRPYEYAGRCDYILLSPAAAERYRPGSATVHRPAGAEEASDHYPVSLELTL